MKSEFDVIVVGGGSGLSVAATSAQKGLKTAIIEPGPMGGTCLNRGCIPSKVLIHSADILEQIKNSDTFGIKIKGYSVDIEKITKRAFKTIDKDAKNIEEGIKQTKNLTLFKNYAEFINQKTLKVGKDILKGKKIIICAGTRPLIPKIEGLEKVKYYTSDNVMRLKKLPKSMVILGGGFIGTELGHFFGTLGTKVTIVQGSKMLNKEDKEIMELFEKEFKKKHNVELGYRANKVSKKGNKIIVTLKSKSTNKTKQIETDSLLLATGRISNTDILKVENTGLKIDKKGYIKANNYFETSTKNIWAFGDIIGKYLLKHSANHEAKYLINNLFFNKKEKVDYSAMPHAVFSSPQIASVGYTENQLIDKKVDYAKGKYYYKSTGMGFALNEKSGFVKILVDKKTKRILGCHIIGPEASTLIHEILIAMKAKLKVDSISNTVHIHPALSEVVQRAVLSIEW